MTESVSGGCLCGAIRYTVNQPVQNMIACHCSHCRKASGGGASYNLPLAASAVTFTQGKTKVYTDTPASGSPLYRHFCPDCGSAIYSQRSAMPGMLVLKAGTLDDTTHMKLVMNIWTQSAQPWSPLDPSVEAHSQNRPVKV